MEDPNNSSGVEKHHSCELPNFELKFFCRARGNLRVKATGVESAG